MAILWFLLTRQNCKVPVAANSQDQLRDTIWPEIGKWHRQLPEALKVMIDVQAERIVVVDAKIATPSAARNLLAFIRVLMDHAIALRQQNGNPAVGVKRPKIKGKASARGRKSIAPSLRRSTH